ncbi:SOH1-domain-containing protein [Aspergillus crustosus]
MPARHTRLQTVKLTITGNQLSPALSCFTLLILQELSDRAHSLTHIMAQPQAEQTQPPATLTNPRFTLELEFVSSLANPYYLSHLAVTYPNLLGISRSREEGDVNDDDADPDAKAFAAYLAYLYSYWKTPEYSQFLTHPGATLRALRLLQEDTFRRDIIRPQVIESLAGLATVNGEQNETAEPGEVGEQNKAEQATNNEGAS